MKDLGPIKCWSCIWTYILHKIRKRKANWIGHILRRNCLLKEVIEGKIKGRTEVTRRRKQLLYDLGDRRGYSHLKEEATDRIKWINRFGRGCGPVVWQITDEWTVIKIWVLLPHLFTNLLIIYVCNTKKNIFVFETYDLSSLKAWLWI
jgi:hypothetical protein